ncbi:MAG: UDP-N-acetylmuramate dehydrogenase [Candidatus Levybacteria bacterium]|nr:UDP-N-acetylmuramate dehydrogenase [Candidatus Levybacteria bacterium]
MNIYENFSLAEILYYKIGGKAKYVLKIQNPQDLAEALAFVKRNHITRILPVGLGANLLMSEDFFDGAIFWFARPTEPLMSVHEDGRIEAFAGYLLDDVIQFSFSHNFIGLEWAGGLPSTAGGAVRGNVGAFGNEIRNIVEKVEVLDIRNEEIVTKILLNEELDFGYRSSIVKKQPHLIITKVFFKLQKADEKKVIEAQNTYFDKIAYRKTHNPVEYPSCGSTFKNMTEKEDVQKILSTWPDITDMSQTKWHGKIAMGYIIRRLGLAGATIGRGQISEKHSNYLINLGGAHFDDIYGLLEKVKETFHQTFGFYPEPEVQVIK